MRIKRQFHATESASHPSAACPKASCGNLSLCCWFVLCYLFVVVVVCLCLFVCEIRLFITTTLTELELKHVHSKHWVCLFVLLCSTTAKHVLHAYHCSKYLHFKLQTFTTLTLGCVCWLVVCVVCCGCVVCCC